MRDLALVLRLIRGAGRRDVVRVVRMALGVGLAVLAALVGLVAPRVASDVRQREAARAPVVSDAASAGGLHLQTSAASLGDRPWTRFTVSGTGPGAPVPPGVGAWPSPGTTLVSPALRRLAASDRGVAVALGRLAAGTVGRDGLTGPDELVSYSISARSDDTAGPTVVGFGNPDAVSGTGSTVPSLLEVAVLVLAPAVLFLVTALRLSVSSRRRRSFALSLVGMSPTRIARAYGWEMGLIALAGVGLGSAAYALGQGVLGTTDLLGIRWFPEQAGLGWPTAGVIAAVTWATVVPLARRSMRTAAGRTRSTRERRGRLELVVAVFLGVPSAGFLAVVLVAGRLHPSDRWAADSYAAFVAAAVLGCVLAVVLAVPPAIARWGERGAAVVRPAYALGLRGAVHRLTSGGRLVAFIALTVMLAGLGAGFVESLHRGALGSASDAQISFDLAGVRNDPHLLTDLAIAPLTIEAPVAGTAGHYDVVVGDCAAIRRQAAVVFDHPGRCTDEVQRGTGGIGGSTARSLRIADRTVPVPQTRTVSDVTWDLKFPLRDAPWVAHLPSAQVTYWVSRSDGSYERVLRTLLRRFPGLRVDAGLKDPVQYAAYRQQIGTIRAAGALGIGLSVAAFLLTAVESRWERTRSLATLAALGVSRRTLRVANLVEFTFPVVVAALPATVVGVAGGWAVLSFRGTEGMFSPAVAVIGALGAVVSLAVAAAVGWATGAATFRREDLADL